MILMNQIHRSHLSTTPRRCSELHLRTRCRHKVNVLIQQIHKKPNFPFPTSHRRSTRGECMLVCMFFHFYGFLEIVYPCLAKNWRFTHIIFQHIMLSTSSRNWQEWREIPATYSSSNCRKSVYVAENSRNKLEVLRYSTATLRKMNSMHRKQG